MRGGFPSHMGVRERELYGRELVKHIFWGKKLGNCGAGEAFLSLF